MIDDLVDYFAWCYANVDAAARRDVRFVVCRDARIETTVHDVDDGGYESAARLIADDERGSAWYYRVHPIVATWTRPVDDLGRASRGARGVKDDTAIVTHLVADVDIVDPSHDAKNLPPDAGAALRLIDETLPPSAVAHSGGGLYPIWRLAHPVDVRTPAGRAALDDVFDRPHRHLAHQHHVDKTMNGTEIVRPVGSVNRKRPKEPRPVRWERHPADGDGDFTLDEIVAHLDRLDATRGTRAAPKTSAASTGTTNPVALLYNARHTWDEILALDERHVWILNPVRSGRPRSWRRRLNLQDGNPETLSLTADGESMIVRSAAIAGEWNVRPGRRLDRFGLACRIARFEPRDFLRAAHRDLDNLVPDPLVPR